MNKQLSAWTGAFGNEYIGRNEVTREKVAGKALAFADMLRPLAGAMPRSILEVGANVGLNLRALKEIVDTDLYALEPNATARQRLLTDHVTEPGRTFDGSAQAIPLGDRAVDLVFTSTVLIHVPPNDLKAACQEIYRVARRYILTNEYFAAKPETIEYRGHGDLLFKRDFGGFWMDEFPQLKLRGYGFLWRRAAAMDSTTWWLFEKPEA